MFTIEITKEDQSNFFGEVASGFPDEQIIGSKILNLRVVTLCIYYTYILINTHLSQGFWGFGMAIRLA